MNKKQARDLYDYILMVRDEMRASVWLKMDELGISKKDQTQMIKRANSGLTRSEFETEAVIGALTEAE